jgi:multisubunit Na+/H+ antiporter MnhB subunit
VKVRASEVVAMGIIALVFAVFPRPFEVLIGLVAPDVAMQGGQFMVLVFAVAWLLLAAKYVKGLRLRRVR